MKINYNFKFDFHCQKRTASSGIGNPLDKLCILQPPPPQKKRKKKPVPHTTNFVIMIHELNKKKKKISKLIFKAKEINKFM